LKGEEVLVSYGRMYWQQRQEADDGQKEVEQCSAIAKVDVVGELLKECELDDEYKKRRAALEAKGRSEPGARVEGGFIWSGGRMCVPATERAKTLVVHECHDEPTGGHLGRDKTAAAVKLRFHWEGVDQWVADYVRSCVKCQQNKTSNQKMAGTLMPLAIPVRPGQQWGLDFVGPLPKTKRGNDGIMTLVDRFAKLKHLVPIRMTIGAREAVGLVWQEVVRLHGVPECLVHDRDPRFTAGFWKAFWQQLQTQLGVSTAYHPQTDGQTERENRTVGEMVRSFVNEEQTDWDEYLPSLELAMNSAVQASTGFSPFHMVYGREAPLPVDVKLKTPVSSAANPAVEELHKKLEEVWKKATKNLERAQERQKRTADKKRRAEEFAVGDKVLLSTENIRMVGSKELKRAVKFAARYIGPFKVERVVNANAYRLELPDSFGIHPTVNITRLKRYVDGAKQFPSREVEEWRPSGEVVLDANGQLEWEVEKVLAQRGRKRSQQYLVKWKGYPLWEATWEKAENLENAAEKVAEFEGRMGQEEEI
jgi:Integrase zinc binding domain/Chromo (CHRromatin Organisation MOdifier) domain